MDASLNGPFGRVPLTSTTLTVGRLPDNQLVLTDPKASSRHAEIRSTGADYTIVDLGSTNGTVLNERRLDRGVEYPLHPGDVIRIGETRITYEASGTPQIAPTVYANQRDSSNYDPTRAAPPVSSHAGSGNASQQNYQYQSAPPSSYSHEWSAYPPPAPPQAPSRKSKRTLFITGGSVLAAVVVLCVIASLVVYATRSTPEKTLNTFCNSLKNKDYQTAYNQLSRTIQSQATESQFEAAFTANNAPQITSCAVSSTSDNGSTGTGRLTYGFNNGRTATQNDKLVYEDGAWKISGSTTS